MNWADFNTRHENCDKAFEDFGRQLFSKWCHSKYSDKIVNIIYVGGKGGDGGVEAFARCIDGSVIGFQAKWFRESFDDNQIKQLEKSIQSARKRHASLTTYIVCMPIELQGSKGRGNLGTAQYERWEAFVKTVDNIEMKFWGDTGIEEVAIETDSHDLVAYWFGNSFINIAGWKQIFQQKRVAWFRSQYIPDLHMQGVYDDLIRRHLLTPASRKLYQKEIDSTHNLIMECGRELERLPSLYNWSQIDASDKKVLLELTTCCSKGIEHLMFLRELLLSDSSLSKIDDTWICPFFTCVKFSTAILKKISDSTPGLSPTRRCKNFLEKLENKEKRILCDIYKELKSIDKPLASLGYAGSGKTHSALAMAQERLDKGFPAIVIPAKAIDPTQSSVEWLPKFIDKPTWGLLNCFEAMESSAFLTFESQEGHLTEMPSRFLLIIDGLEESAHSEAWCTALSEWEEILKSFPHVKLICSVRPAPADKLIPEGFHKEYPTSQHNVPLHLLFKKYCNSYSITVADDSWIQWAIKTPREIRLFADVYKGKILHDEATLATSISGLMKAKITDLEDRLKNHKIYGWRSLRPILLDGLISLARHLLKDDSNAIEHDKLVYVMRQGCDILSEMDLSSINYIIDELVNNGVLDRQIIAGQNDLDGELLIYYPTNQSVLDFLIANSAFSSLRKDKNNNYIVPPIFKNCFEALTIFLQMLNEENQEYACVGNVICDSSINTSSVVKAQLIALSRSNSEVPDKVKDWVVSLLLENKIKNSLVFELLILQTARNIKHKCNAKLVHALYLNMPVAQRDLIWSCPDDLPYNCGGIWEGYAENHLNNEMLYSHDIADGMPLLLAWSCSSVVADRVRKARNKLAVWGSENPQELAILLSLFENCNDYQVLENILVASVGAACLTEDEHGLKALSDQCYKMFFTDNPICTTRNAVCRHAARVVVEKAYACRLVSEECINNARPPYKASAELLPFKVLSDVNVFDNPVNGDLEWYVVKNATRGFFEQVKVNEISDEELTPDSKIIDAVLSGRILLDEVHVQKLGQLLEKMEEARTKRDTALEQAVSMLTVKFENALRIANHEGAEPNTGRINPENLDTQEAKYSPEAATLVNEYIAKYNLACLNPDELRDGIIIAFVYLLGWNPREFIGNPNGGNPGEVLGADLSITRNFASATHGSRSQVASFAEKYVWLAVNEVAGDFSDRMPVSDDFGRSFSPVNDYSSVGAGMPEPFDSLNTNDDLVDTLVVRDLANDFLGKYQSSGINQVERATDWVTSADWPDVKEIISRNGNFSICSWLHGVEPFTAVCQQAAFSCMLVSENVFDLLKRDVKSGSGILHNDCGEPKRGGVAGGVYHSPSVVYWAPWIRTVGDCDESYVSINDKGVAVKVELRHLASSIYWTHDGDETQLYFPSPFYVKDLGIVKSKGGKDVRDFLDNSGRMVARYEYLNQELSVTVQQLLLSNEKMEFLLQVNRSVAVWVVEVYREVPPEYIPEVNGTRSRWPQRRAVFVYSKKYSEPIEQICFCEL